MDFFKKLFGGKKDGAETASAAGGTFKCEKCGQERQVTQKKKWDANTAGQSKNVCEFC